MKKNRGFTLIELLVVIAIIGLLTSVVMVSLSYARKKGADAAIKANLTQIRNQAELFYDDNGGSYGADSSGDCATADSLFVSSTTPEIIAELTNVSGTAPTCYADDGDVADVGTAATTWAVSVPLRTDPLTNWCVDSSGISASGTAMIDVSTEVAVCSQ